MPAEGYIEIKRGTEFFTYVCISRRFVPSMTDTVCHTEFSLSARQMYYFVYLWRTHIAGKNSMGRRAGRLPSRKRVFLTWALARVTVLCIRNIENRERYSERWHTSNSRTNIYILIFEKAHLALESRGGHCPPSKIEWAPTSPGGRMPNDNSVCRVRSPPHNILKTMLHS